jgi:hypothetical protein
MQKGQLLMDQADKDRLVALKEIKKNRLRKRRQPRSWDRVSAGAAAMH